MYQEFFKLAALPFSLLPNTQFFCQLKGHQEALNTLLFCINSGEGFIKIVGEVGSGKTLLCRKLLESLTDDKFETVYIPNPDLSPIELRKAFARELGLDPSKWQDQHELLTAIYQHLIHLSAKGKQVVFIVDEAQALSDESLETIRLLTNLETEHTRLLQVILFGQPELDLRLREPHLRQLMQRISFSYSLSLMNKAELDVYLHHRLAVAGYTHNNLFTKKARKLLFRASRGIPRIVNIISHKALLVAYGRGEHQVNHEIIQLAVDDTECASLKSKSNRADLIITTLIVIAVTAIITIAIRSFPL